MTCSRSATPLTSITLTIVNIPISLTDLVNEQDHTLSYLRDIPRDPFTGAADWITVSPEGGEEGGVFDVHSASPLIAVDGTAYNTW